jgi:osmotically inducible lipoprotein OsmB
MNIQRTFISLALGTTFILGGCAGMSGQEVSTATGAAVGAVAGSVIGGPAATVGGAVIGGAIGHEVGKKK